MNRGIASTWHKWDFHVHTPYSILNNGYGVDPFTTESEASFDQYIQSLFLKTQSIFSWMPSPWLPSTVLA